MCLTKMPELVYGPPVAHSNVLTVVLYDLDVHFSMKSFFGRGVGHITFSQKQDSLLKALLLFISLKIPSGNVRFLHYKSI